MDFLKWILKASFLMALMFLGVSSEPDNKDSDQDNAKQPVNIFQAPI